MVDFSVPGVQEHPLPTEGNRSGQVPPVPGRRVRAGIGSEAAHRRPAIIVSNDAANVTAARLGRGVVTVVPVTGNVDRIYPFQVSLPARRCQLAVDSKAQAEQVRAVAVERIGTQVGRLPADLMNKVDHALRLHLAL